MGRIIKEMKPFTLSILLIIVLLLGQANSDLLLPSYMSNIVNTGIQRNGIEDSVMEFMDLETKERIELCLSEEEVKLLNENYLPMEKTEENLKKYPFLQEKEIFSYVGGKDKAEIEKLMSKGIFMSLEIEKNIEGGMDSFKELSREERNEKLQDMEKDMEVLPKNLVEGVIINSVKDSYEALGIDIGKKQSSYIFKTGLIMLIIALLGMVCSIFVGYFASKVSAKLGRNLRNQVFDKVASFSSSEFNEFSTASLITRSTNDIQQVQQFSVLLLRMVFYAPIIAFGGIIRVLNTNTSMAWIIGVGVLAIVTIVIVVFSIATPKFKILQKYIDKVNLVLRESLTGMLVVRAFNNEKEEEDRFDRANTDLSKLFLFISRTMTLLSPLMMILMNGISLLIIWVGAKQIDAGNILVGDMMAFMQYTTQIIMAFLMISMVSIILPRASVSINRIVDILDKDPQIKDAENPTVLPVGFKGDIKFSDVFFKYEEAEEPILKDINFIAEGGKTTAIIGSTGSGKSSIINLIPRFYDITGGSITIDGIDVRDIKLENLRDNIGFVPQKATLFSGDIESNLKYGKNRMASLEDVNQAIQISQSKEFVDEKEDGIKTHISQGGKNVSGGQRQRLSIARALVNKPKILIFDDSFSALDFKTDAQLRGELAKFEETTKLIVAQRINTIIDADKILVLDEGKIVGQGTHGELLRDCEVYKEIASSQLSEEELKNE